MSRARLWGMAAVLGASVVLSCAAPVAAASGISGRVVDTASNPLRGIEACAELRPGQTSNPNLCTQTDSNGEYSIPSAVPGDLVHFRSTRSAAPAYAPQWWPGVPFSDEAQPVAEADVESVDATMVPGGTISGRLLSQATSLPIEGVTVCASLSVFRELEDGSCATSDAEGRFVLRGLSGAEYRLDLWTEGDVNFVATRLGPVPVELGRTAEVETSLTPGVEIAGTITEAATGSPIEWPDTVPRICAVAPVTEDLVKCTSVGAGGHYSIPGIPPDRPFGVSFAVDAIEEGVDTYSDGFVRRYWDEVPNWSEATFLSAPGGSVLEHVDAALTRGPEVFPRCEVQGYCTPPPTPPQTLPAAPVTPAHDGGPSSAGPPSTSPARVPATHRCAAGFRRAIGHSRVRCVKAYKGSKRRRHRRHQR